MPVVDPAKLYKGEQLTVFASTFDAAGNSLGYNGTFSTASNGTVCSVAYLIGGPYVNCVGSGSDTVFFKGTNPDGSPFQGSLAVTVAPTPPPPPVDHVVITLNG